MTDMARLRILCAKAGLAQCAQYPDAPEWRKMHIEGRCDALNAVFAALAGNWRPLRALTITGKDGDK